MSLQSPVFLLNSRYPLVSAPEFPSEEQVFIKYYRALLSLSYESNLQSSLSGVLSRA